MEHQRNTHVAEGEDDAHAPWTDAEIIRSEASARAVATNVLCGALGLYFNFVRAADMRNGGNTVTR
jgi:hypothetical protein